MFMKSATLIVLIVFAAATLAVTSCETTGNRIDRNQIPSFYLTPPTSKDTLYGVGYARMSSLDLSRTTAVARARADVAGQVQASVKTALTDYAQQAGEGENNQALQFVESVSRQIVDVTLAGCRTDKVEVIDDGTVYALVSYPITNLMAAAGSQFRRNEAAAFAGFKAEEAVSRLNDEIRNKSRNH
jgi:hypothetical protein